MKGPHHRRDALAILTGGLVLLGSAGAVGAQPAVGTEPAPVARSFSELKGRVQSGATIFVTDAADREVRGKLSDLSETSLNLLVDGQLRAFPQSDVGLVKLRQPDSLWNGVLIGVAAGAVPAVYWRFADPNECGGSICMDDLVIGVIPGALIGLAVDAAVQKRVIVYRSPSQSSARTAVAVMPIAAHRRKGVALTISFD